MKERQLLIITTGGTFDKQYFDRVGYKAVKRVIAKKSRRGVSRLGLVGVERSQHPFE
ncbi:MAG TPA: hypothetical protein VGH23_22040 [Rhizomicrobium sp.]|jgi:hypothetical protein